MSVRIVTDSTAHLDPSLIDEFQITVVPVHVRIGEREYLDGVDLDEREFYRLVYQEGLQPHTAAPTVEEFRRVYEEQSRHTSEILSIHISESLSGTIANAREAANFLLGRCEIEIVNSQTLSLGLGILVEAAARAAAEGMPVGEIERMVRGLIQRIYVVFFSENLDYLERSGKMSRAQAILGTILGIKPFLTLEEGEIMPIEKVRSREQAIEKLIEFVAEFDEIEQLAIMKGYFNPPEEIDLLRERIQALFPDLEAQVMNYGPVLASHVGPDTLGIIVYESEVF